MYLPEGMAILICSGGKRNVLLLVKKTMHVFARRGGNFDVFWCKYECVVQSPEGVASLFC